MTGMQKALDRCDRSALRGHGADGGYPPFDGIGVETGQHVTTAAGADLSGYLAR